jgi:hypothetical protein
MKESESEFYKSRTRGRSFCVPTPQPCLKGVWIPETRPASWKELCEIWHLAASQPFLGYITA